RRKVDRHEQRIGLFAKDVVHDLADRLVGRIVDGMRDGRLPDAHGRDGREARLDEFVHVVNLLDGIAQVMHMQGVLQLVAERAAGKAAHAVNRDMDGRRGFHYAPFIRALSSSDSALTMSKVVSMPTSSPSSTTGMAWKRFSRKTWSATLIRSFDDRVAIPVVMI